MPKYLKLHKDHHVKCLSEFFEVIIIREDCDYQMVCDRYKPDLTLFESGVSAVNIRNKLNIQNTSAFPEIPKLGFHNGDSFCASRSAFIADMEHWGIETFFSINVSMAEYTPEISNNLFIWPNFVDSDLYRDYHEHKIIPVLFTGSQAAHYPWRQKMHQIISQNYPSLTCPHLGWTDERNTSRMIYGKQYAQLINASWFVPSCGTVAKELVRKLFEIPACKTCLITEKTSAAINAGFVDMQNCIFANDNDVLDKLDYLFQNVDEFEKIINAGYQLVHSKHTLKQRDQIYQWFKLYKNLQPNQKIVQTNPFEPLIVVEKASETKNSHIITNGLDRLLLRQGDEELLMGNYDEAEFLYRNCLNYITYLVEPKLRLALCSLYKGDANTAHRLISPLIQYSLENEQALKPDPVEWAYLIISCLCQGKLNDAIHKANQFPSLRHPELDRTRWVINILSNSGVKNELLQEEALKYNYSVHLIPRHNLIEWISHLCHMLKACNQVGLVAILQNSSLLKDKLTKSSSSQPNSLTLFCIRLKTVIYQELYQIKLFNNLYHSYLVVKARLKQKLIAVLIKIKLINFVINIKLVMQKILSSK